MDSDAEANLAIVVPESSDGVLVVPRGFKAILIAAQNWRSIVGYLTCGIALDGNFIRVWRVRAAQQSIQGMVGWGGTAFQTSRGRPWDNVF